MTITWEFINIPRNKQLCIASLSPSIADHIFEFNLGAHKKGEETWVKVSENYISGDKTHNLQIRVKQDQHVLLLVKDRKGVEKNISFDVKKRWIDKGDICSTSEPINYQKYFVDSLGISEGDMYCEALFEEYRKLEVKNHITSQDYISGVDMKTKHINLQDSIRINVLAKELIKCCEGYFKNKSEEWRNIEINAKD
ncbi:hypothetical protein LCGC14_2427230 [marine sediment metagenome]|uniref:Uncharacterized protein n=1 Tax=marine sediment metagenome TaxID=412755 RepID=A0A0F9CA88_9ZZZZ